MTLDPSIVIGILYASQGSYKYVSVCFETVTDCGVILVQST